ncbi:MAG TPA: thymidine kinase [Candidatus Limnocylindrales bacterium]|nr:thymidine kinase [Candidatus Limnocylindrales bacterium]
MFYRADPWLHVIVGCMSSGKTDELLRLLRRAEYARRRILLVRPEMDTRTPPEYAESRSLARYPSRVIPTDDPWKIVTLARESDADLVGIDEAEFFVPEVVAAVEALRRSGRHVIVTGLNTDFAARPFGSMPELMAVADEVSMLTAICVICGETATRTQRLVNGRPAAIDDPLVVIGGMDAQAVETYEARCNRHHEIAPPRAETRPEAASIPLEL